MDRRASWLPSTTFSEIPESLYGEPGLAIPCREQGIF
jgi:hypothetical protein